MGTINFNQLRYFYEYAVVYESTLIESITHCETKHDRDYDSLHIKLADHFDIFELLINGR